MHVEEENCAMHAPSIQKRRANKDSKLQSTDEYPPNLDKLRQCTQLLRSLRPLQLGQGRGLRATHTTADTHMGRPHVLKLAIQHLWAASDFKKK